MRSVCQTSSTPKSYISHRYPYSQISYPLKTIHELDGKALVVESAVVSYKGKLSPAYTEKGNVEYMHAEIFTGYASHI